MIFTKVVSQQLIWQVLQSNPKGLQTTWRTKSIVGVDFCQFYQHLENKNSGVFGGKKGKTQIMRTIKATWDHYKIDGIHRNLHSHRIFKRLDASKSSWLQKEPPEVKITWEHRISWELGLKKHFILADYHQKHRHLQRVPLKHKLNSRTFDNLFSNGKFLERARILLRRYRLF